MQMDAETLAALGDKGKEKRDAEEAAELKTIRRKNKVG